MATPPWTWDICVVICPSGLFLPAGPSMEASVPASQSWADQYMAISVFFVFSFPHDAVVVGHGCREK